MEQIRVIPSLDAECGWWQGLSPRETNRLGEGQRADCTIIGTGFTGLSLARALALHRPDWRIVLIDALEVGQGASGRSSGVVAELPRFRPRLGQEGNRLLVALSRQGLDTLEDLVHTHEIHCDWTRCPQLHVAVKPRGQKKLDEFIYSLDRMKEPYERLNTERIMELCGTAHYVAAVKTPGGALVHPTRLLRGLADSLPSNVVLCENSPVLKIKRDKQHWLLDTDRARLQTLRIAFATNGYTRFFNISPKIAPMLTFCSLTRPLTAKEQLQLGNAQEWALIPEEPLGSTLRRTKDHRLLIQNHLAFSPHAQVTPQRLATAKAEHRRSLNLRFPTLQHVELTSTWGGVLGTTLDNRHHFGQIAPNLFVAAAYNGQGIALATTLGLMLAALIANKRSRQLNALLALPKPLWLPPNPLLQPGLIVANSLFQALAKNER